MEALDGHATPSPVDWNRLADSLAPDTDSGDSGGEVAAVKWAAAWKRAAKYNRDGWRMAASIAARSITRNAVRELAAYWPTLDHIPDGDDIRPEDGLLPKDGPISGLPDGETLSRLVADGHVEGDE